MAETQPQPDQLGEIDVVAEIISSPATDLASPPARRGRGRPRKTVTTEGPKSVPDAEVLTEPEKTPVEEVVKVEPPKKAAPKAQEIGNGREPFWFLNRNR